MSAMFKIVSRIICNFHHPHSTDRPARRRTERHNAASIYYRSEQLELRDQGRTSFTLLLDTGIYTGMDTGAMLVKGLRNTFDL